MNNLEIWGKLNQPPKWALKEIRAGRLKGKSDINPQWRYYALTEVFGPCGTGWKFTIDKLWIEPGNGNEVFAFAMVTLYVNNGGQWSAPIPGVGGSKLVQQESSGPHNNDEGYKMAVTDAMSTACKMLGVASDVYMGLWDGAKYINRELPQSRQQQPKKEPAKAPPIDNYTQVDIPGSTGPESQEKEAKLPGMTKTQQAKLKWLCEQKGMTDNEGMAVLNFHSAGQEITKQIIAEYLENFDAIVEKYIEAASNPVQKSE